jgi:CO/xanthine dehydrogenase Mo-binding subunit
VQSVNSSARAVGTNVARKDGAAKVRGGALYVDDLRLPGMLHARTVRSTVACGEITAVRVEAPGCVVVDHRDVPGRNVVALIQDDQPCLVEREVRHYAEPILLLAHEDPEALLAARVEIEYRERPAVLDPRLSTAVCKEIRIEKGDPSRGLARADLVVEGTYTTGHQEQLYLETNGVVAVPEQGGVTVYGSLQCPYYVLKALEVLLGGRPVRVVQVETGGGFGGKEDYPSIIAGHAALLALKSGRPVKLVYDRVEDMLATTKRHPSIVRYRTGVTRDGRLTAMEIDVLLDAGAYVTLSPVVLSRGTLHATGPYRCDDVRVHGRAVRTNTPPNGAFRGFGAPQTLFAAEVQMERVAEALGIDPVRLREVNALRPGDTTATGQVMGADCSARRVLREAVRRSDFRRKRRDYAREGKGIGLALFFHGSGFTGGGETRLASRATLELVPSGARIRVASTEIGQGTRTIHAQIVADALGLPYEAVESCVPDTALVPDSGPTVASRTCMVVGRLLERAAKEMRARLRGLTPAVYLKRHGPLVITKEYVPPPGLQWDEETYTGDAYGAYGWACDVVELQVDPVTLEVRPLRVTAVAEVGKAIHPLLAAGQIEGGTAQGLGFALLEEVVMRDGRMLNAQLTNYLLPTSVDTPPIDTVILENPYPHGPQGAKGLGEMPIDGPAPAVVNALRHAGFDVRDVPATPERLARCARLDGAAQPRAKRRTGPRPAAARAAARRDKPRERAGAPRARRARG